MKKKVKLILVEGNKNTGKSLLVNHLQRILKKNKKACSVLQKSDNKKLSLEEVKEFCNKFNNCDYIIIESWLFEFNTNSEIIDEEILDYITKNNSLLAFISRGAPEFKYIKNQKKYKEDSKIYAYKYHNYRNFKIQENFWYANKAMYVVYAYRILLSLEYKYK